MNDDRKPKPNVSAAQMQAIAELETRRYFDHYLRAVFPQQVQTMIELHDKDAAAHGGVERRFNRMMWLIAGVCTASGAGAGFTIPQLFGLF